MALRIRRGSEGERSGVTFEQGELVWVSNSTGPRPPHKLYVGDGTTPGGIDVIGSSAGYGLVFNSGAGVLEVSGLTADDIANGVNNKFFSAELAQDAAASLFTNGSHQNIAFTYDDSLGTINATVTLDGIGLINISDDLSPSLGGNLDLNTNSIVGDGGITVTGNIDVGGFIANNQLLTFTISCTSGAITVSSASGMSPGMPIMFGLPTQTSPVLGNIQAYKVYYIRTVIGNVITIAETQGGVQWSPTDDTATMTVVANGVIANILTARAVDVVGMLNLQDMSGFGKTNSIYSVGGVLAYGSQYDPSSHLFNVDADGGTPFTIRGVTGPPGGSTTNIKIGVQRGSLAVPSLIQNGDLLGSVLFSGYTGTAGMGGYANAAAVGAVVSDTSPLSGLAEFKGTIFLGATADLNVGKATLVEPGGILSAPIFKATGYATGSLPSSPAEGWIVFDSTTKEFKGYNGTAWVVLG